MQRCVLYNPIPAQWPAILEYAYRLTMFRRIRTSPCTAGGEKERGRKLGSAGPQL